jgi:rubredoxin
MKHKCYTCGFVLRNGIPLLEDITADRKVLNGTPFEDLTPYNFCAYCLHMLTEFPSAFLDEDDHVLVQEAGKVACSCGHPHSTLNGWVRVNRSQIAHKAVAIYQNGNFSLALDLISAGI